MEKSISPIKIADNNIPVFPVFGANVGQEVVLEPKPYATVDSPVESPVVPPVGTPVGVSVVPPAGPPVVGSPVIVPLPGFDKLKYRKFLELGIYLKALELYKGNSIPFEGDFDVYQVVAGTNWEVSEIPILDKYPQPTKISLWMPDSAPQEIEASMPVTDKEVTHIGHLIYWLWQLMKREIPMDLRANFPPQVQTLGDIIVYQKLEPDTMSLPDDYIQTILKHNPNAWSDTKWLFYAGMMF